MLPRDVANDIIRTLEEFEPPSVTNNSSNGGNHPHQEEFSSSSSSKTYAEEWEKYFNNTNNDGAISYDNLKFAALQGSLRNCRFRSVCWRNFIGVLSNNPENWQLETTRIRENYTKLKNQNLFDPEFGMDKFCTMDEANDPLSLDENSVWNKYFRYKDTRREILQDVVRTFPELQFFHDETIRQIMVNILLCFSTVSSLGYKQGMHEILAPLLFVLYCDQIAFEDAREKSATISLDVFEKISILLNPDYLEHDAFAMFSAIMFHIGDWYSLDKSQSITTSSHHHHYRRHPHQQHQHHHNLPQSQHHGSQYDANKKPFESDLNLLSIICPVLGKLHFIHEILLKQIDKELYNYLKVLDVTPQMFGLRWLRLLFGREFPLQDLLIVWDAIFAIQNQFILVDYIYLGMLLLLKDLLLRCDFSKALGFLLHYPHVMDIHALINQALYMFDSETFKKPSEIPLPASPALSERSLSKQKIVVKKRRSGGGGFDALSRLGSEMLPKISSLSFLRSDSESSSSSKMLTSSPAAAHSHQQHQQLPTISPLDEMNDDFETIDNSGFSSGTVSVHRNHTIPRSSNSQQYRHSMKNNSFPAPDFVEIRLPHERRADVAVLHNYKEMNRHCSRILDLCVYHVQDILLKDQISPTTISLNEKKKINLSVAAMKHIRDMLKGDIPYDKTIIKRLSQELDVDITGNPINDSAAVKSFPLESVMEVELSQMSQ